MDPNPYTPVVGNMFIMHKILQDMASIDEIIKEKVEYSDINPKLKPYVDLILQDDTMKPYNQAILKIVKSVDKHGDCMNLRFLYTCCLVVILKSSKINTSDEPVTNIAFISKLIKKMLSFEPCMQSCQHPLNCAFRELLKLCVGDYYMTCAITMLAHSDHESKLGEFAENLLLLILDIYLGSLACCRTITQYDARMFMMDASFTQFKKLFENVYYALR